MKTIQSKCVGQNYRPQEAQQAWRHLLHHGAVQLEPEPENPYDTGAVKVLIGEGEDIGMHVGYLPKGEDTRMIQKALIDGVPVSAFRSVGGMPAITVQIGSPDGVGLPV